MRKASLFLCILLVLGLFSMLPQTAYCTQIFSEDFESGKFSTNWTSTSNASSTQTIETGNPHHGTYNYKVTSAYTNDVPTLRKTLASSTTTFNIRTYFKTADLARLTSTAHYIYIAHIRGSGGIISQIGIAYNGTSSTIRYFIDYFVGTAAVRHYSTTVAGAYYTSVEGHLTVHASAGILQLWINGTQEVNLSGLDTNDHGTTVTDFRLCGGWNLASAPAGGIFQDCIICTDGTYIGPEVTAQNYVADLSQGITAGPVILAQWNALFNPSQSISGSFSAGQIWDAVFNPSQGISGSFDVGQNWDAIFDPSSGWTFTFDAGPNWDALVDVSQSASFSILVDIVQGLFYLAELAQNIGIAILVDIIHSIATTGLTLYVVLALAILALTIALGNIRKRS